MNKRIKDNFFKKSKEENVRSRSYFKIQQIDNKFNIFSNVHSVLDLGCAPGGWMQYINKEHPNVKIIGVDLLPIRHRHEFNENVEIIEDDFHNLEHYTQEQFDIVLSDMAPEFSGDIQIDKGRVHDMNHKTLQLSKKHLKKDGLLVFKTFGGKELEGVRSVAKQLFKEIKEFKPRSSDQSSPEIFIVCFHKL